MVNVVALDADLRAQYIGVAEHFQRDRNTSNLSKHLKYRDLDLYTEFSEGVLTVKFILRNHNQKAGGRLRAKDSKQ